MQPLALVTGGAGLIGSHLADLLLVEGWRVRILDNLEPQTHSGKPAWLPPAAEFHRSDIRDTTALRSALDGVEVVFHQAAYGGYMPEIAKFIEVNSLGTARLLELIRDERLPVRKLVVASSQAVYQEGAVKCSRHGRQFPRPRSDTRLAAGDYLVACPICGGVTVSTPTPEDAPIGGENVYAMTKLDQERLVLNWSRQTGIPAVALRYSCTYGPRQSIRNPYTGVIAIFANRLRQGLAPVFYEDGEQTRDLCYVEDIARANLLAAGSSDCDGLAVNVGSGVATSVRTLARTIAERLGVPCNPVIRGEYRPGEMRDLVADITLARRLGFEPRIGLGEGIGRFVDWLARQDQAEDGFTAAEAILRRKGIVQPSAAQVETQ